METKKDSLIVKKSEINPLNSKLENTFLASDEMKDILPVVAKIIEKNNEPEEEINYIEEAYNNFLKHVKKTYGVNKKR